MKPGTYSMSNEAYHSGPGLSSSRLKDLLISPKHYRARLVQRLEPTPEMLRGTLVHALILEPEKFDSEFAVGDFKIRRGKEYDKLVEENPDKKVISLDELTEARKVVNSFHEQADENPELKALISTGKKELSHYWEDPRTGILCKCRPDNHLDFGVIVDIKTTRDAGFDSFQKDIANLGYYISAAFYLRGVRATTEVNPPENFVIVAIETKEPYAVAIYRLGEQALRMGNDLVDVALNRYSESVATDQWAGYSKKCIDIELPSWANYKLNSVYGIK